MTGQRDHRTTYGRRNERARELGFGSYYQLRKAGGARAVSGQSRRVIDRLPGRAQEVRRASIEAVNLMRRDRLLLSQAARRAGVSTGAVRFWAKDAIGSGGRALAADRLLRRMVILTNGQQQVVDIHGSRQASMVAGYWNSVSRFLQTGDTSPLQPFVGKTVAGFELETDPDVLEDLALVGSLEFEDIYALGI